MKKPKFKKIVSLIMALTMSLSILSVNTMAGTGQGQGRPADSEAIATQDSFNEEVALEILSNERLSGLQFFDDIRLDTSEKISVIVELKNLPAEVAKAIDTITGEINPNTRRLKDYNALAAADKSSFYKGLSSLSIPYEITWEFDTAINGVSMWIPANRVKDLLAIESVYAVYPNETVTLDPPVDVEEPMDAPSGVYGDDDTRQWLGVDVQDVAGARGEGVLVGVLDTGVDYYHPDLIGMFLDAPPEGSDGTTRTIIVDGKEVTKFFGWNFVSNSSYPKLAPRDNNDPYETEYSDWYGTGYPQYNDRGSEFYTEHGTHTAGEIGARGVNNNLAAGYYRQRGNAPEANVIMYRVLGPYGSGATDGIIKGMEQAAKDGCDIISMSLGAAGANGPYYITSIVANYLTLAYDTLFCISAGNEGSNLYTLGSPGTASLALTLAATSVGASGSLASFSSRGPVATTHEIKPDLTTPGVNVYSTGPYWRNNTNKFVRDYQRAYYRENGTSMACPQAAGLAAVIMGENIKKNGGERTISAVEVKARLMNSANQSGMVTTAYSVHAIGAGRPIIANALNNPAYVTVEYNNVAVRTTGSQYEIVKSNVASFNFGSSGYQNTSPVTKTLKATIHNTGNQPVTYNVAETWNTSGQDVKTKPAAMSMNISPQTVTVPAGEEATFTVSLTIPANMGASAAGSYQGYINLTGDYNMRLPFALQMVSMIPTLGDAFVTSPIITGNWGTAQRTGTASNITGSTGKEKAMQSSLWLHFNQIVPTGNYSFMYISKAEEFDPNLPTNSIIGFFPTQENVGGRSGHATGSYLIMPNKLTPWYYAFKDTGEFDGYFDDYSYLESGHYVVSATINTDYKPFTPNTSEMVNFDIYVDNEAPELTVNSVDIGAKKITGNVYDAGVEDIVAKQIPFRCYYNNWYVPDRSILELIAVVDGAYYCEASVSENGDFVIDLNNLHAMASARDSAPVSTSITADTKIQLYAYDGFMIQANSFTAANTSLGFSPNGGSFRSIVNSTYMAYVGANCTSYEFTMGQEAEISLADYGDWTMTVGESKTFYPVYNGSAAAVQHEWTTSNSAVADVYDGTVTAVAPGTAYITVKAGNGMDTIMVTVVENGFAEIDVSAGVIINPEDYIFLGATNHPTGLSNANGYGTVSAWEGYDAPILWRVMGEEQTNNGPDGYLTLMSRYALDSKEYSQDFSAHYNDSFAGSYLNSEFLKSFTNGEDGVIPEFNVTTAYYTSAAAEQKINDGYIFHDFDPTVVFNQKAYLPWSKRYDTNPSVNGIYTYWSSDDAPNANNLMPDDAKTATLKKGTTNIWQAMRSKEKTEDTAMIQGFRQTTSSTLTAYRTDQYLGLRPLTKLIPEQIVYAYPVVENGEQSQGKYPVDSNLYYVPADVNVAYKLTVQGRGNGVSVGTVNYSGAAVHADGIHIFGVTASATEADYSIAYKVVDEFNSIVRYGEVPANMGPQEIIIPFENYEDTNTIYMWVQQNFALNSNVAGVVQIVELGPKVVDKTALEEALAYAATFNENDYTPESFAVLTAAVEYGQQVFDNAEATQEKVDGAVAMINDAIAQLVPVTPVDKTELEEALEYAATFDATDYTPESFAVLTAAVENGQLVYNNEEATQEEVDEAVQMIYDAIEQLVPVTPVDKTELEEALAYAATFDAVDYTPASFAVLTAAVENGLLVYNNAEATQEEVDAAVQMIYDAIAQLVEVTPVVDKTELEEALAYAATFDANDYTPDSFAVLTAAVEHGQMVYDNEEATQEEVDAAVQMIYDAIEQLVEVTPVVDKTELENALAYAATFDGNAYTPESFAVLTAAIEHGQLVYNNAEATQEEVDDAVQMIYDAIAQLVQPGEDQGPTVEPVVQYQRTHVRTPFNFGSGTLAATDITEIWLKFTNPSAAEASATGAVQIELDRNADYYIIDGNIVIVNDFVMEFAYKYKLLELDLYVTFNDAKTTEVKTTIQINYADAPVMVKFDAMGGTPVPKSVLMLRGDAVAKPADPAYGEYNFNGWYTADGTLWNFETPVMDDMILYARWTMDEAPWVYPDAYYEPGMDVRIPFGYGLGTLAATDITEVWFKTYVDPAMAEILGMRYIELDRGYDYWIDGEYIVVSEAFVMEWMYYFNILDMNLEVTFNDTAKTVAPTTIHMDWNDAPVMVKFDAMNGTPVSSVMLNRGKTVARPEDPVRENHIFLGWYTINNELWDFNKPIMADMTLYAEWEYASAPWVHESVDYMQGQDVRIPFGYGAGRLAATDIDSIYFNINVAPRGNSIMGIRLVELDRGFDYWIEGDYIVISQAFLLKQAYEYNVLTLSFTVNFNDMNVTEAPTGINIPAEYAPVKVFFDARGGEPSTTVYVSRGLALAKPADPVRNGYSFKGWITANGDLWDFGSPLNYSITLYAKWEATPAGGYVDPTKKAEPVESDKSGVISVPLPDGNSKGNPVDPPKDESGGN